MEKFFFSLCVFILSVHFVEASDDNEKRPTVHGWQIGGMYHRGKMHNHSSYITPMIERSAVGGEFFLSKQTHGAHHWNSFFNYPEYGVSYTFLDVGSPTFVGNVHCLFPYLKFHFFNNHSRANIHLRMGLGLGYSEKIYRHERINDWWNFATSTHLNAALSGQLQASYRAGSNWNFLAGAGITHLSNGAYKIPNMGMNIFSLFSGMAYSFGKERFIVSGDKTDGKNKNWDCSVIFLAGVKERYPIGGSKYFAGDFNVEVTKKHLRYTRFGLSLDATHDTSEYDDGADFQSLSTAEKLRATKIGVSGGYVWLFGDLSLDLYLGTYLHDESGRSEKIYQRTSLRYPLSNRVKMLITLRNHKGRADYIGLGFGVSLTK